MTNGIKKSYLIALAVAVGVIVVGIASSYAYFAITMTSATDEGPDFVASVDASSESVTVTQLHAINNPDKRPGYKDYLSFSVTSTSSVNYDVTMNAVSTLVTGVNYKVYKSTSSLTVASTCSDSDDAENNQYSSSCTVTGLDLLTPEATGQISSATTAYTLLEGETLNGTVYYYIVLEYPNEDFSQDDDFFKTLTATVTINTGNATIDTTQPRQLTTAMLQDNGITDINDVPERTNSSGGGIKYLSSSKYYNASQLDLQNRGFNSTKTASGASGTFDEAYVGEDINIFRTNNAENGETVLYYSGANGYAKDYTYKGQSIYNTDDTLATLDGSSVDLIRVGGRYYLKDDTKVSSITPAWTELAGTCKYAGYVIYADDNGKTISSKADCEKQMNILDNKGYSGEFIENANIVYYLPPTYATPSWEGTAVKRTPSWNGECDSWDSDGSGSSCAHYTYSCQFDESEVYNVNGDKIQTKSDCEKSTLLVNYNGGYRMAIEGMPTWESYNCTTYSDGSYTDTSCDYRCVYNSKNVYDKNGNTISSESNCEKTSALVNYNSGYKMMDMSDGTCKYNGKEVKNSSGNTITSQSDCEKKYYLENHSSYYQISTGYCAAKIINGNTTYIRPVYDTSNRLITSQSACITNAILIERDNYSYKMINLKKNVTPTWTTATGTAYACKYNNKIVFKEDKRVITSENDCTSGNYFVNNDSYTKIKSEDYITNATLEGNYVGVNNWVIFGKVSQELKEVRGYYSATSKDKFSRYSSMSECNSGSPYNNNCEEVTVAHAGDDMYWRIIRTNEASTGGGIRLLYSGSGLAYNSSDSTKHIINPTVNNATIGKTAFNSSQNNYKYVGYTFGNGTDTLSGIRGNDNDSDIKTYIDNWYKATLLNTDYEKEINTKAVYCNDRSTTTSVSTLLSNVDFGAYGRIYNINNNANGRNPSYACGASLQGFGNWYNGGNDNADRYTATTYELGNGYLDYPAALMTIDEVVFGGGGKAISDSKLWYYANPNGLTITSNSSWWLLSAFYGNIAGSASLFHVNDNSFGVGGFNYNPATYIYAARPVLSLKSDTLITGQGTATNPYVVQVREN